MKILNLYACLGGNRYKWDEVADVEVTAVEWDEELAKLYQERFPNDKVIVVPLLLFLVIHMYRHRLVYMYTQKNTQLDINICTWLFDRNIRPWR